MTVATGQASALHTLAASGVIDFAFFVDASREMLVVMHLDRQLEGLAVAPIHADRANAASSPSDSRGRTILANAFEDWDVRSTKRRRCAFLMVFMESIQGETLN